MITQEERDELAKAYFAFHGTSVETIDIGNNKIYLYSENGFEEIDCDAIKPATELLWRLFSARMTESLTKHYAKQRLNEMLYQLAIVDIKSIDYLTKM